MFLLSCFKVKIEMSHLKLEHARLSSHALELHSEALFFFMTPWIYLHSHWIVGLDDADDADNLDDVWMFRAKLQAADSFFSPLPFVSAVPAVP